MGTGDRGGGSPGRKLSEWVSIAAGLSGMIFGAAALGVSWLSYRHAAAQDEIRFGSYLYLDAERHAPALGVPGPVISRINEETAADGAPMWGDLFAVTLSNEGRPVEIREITLYALPSPDRVEDGADGWASAAPHNEAEIGYPARVGKGETIVCLFDRGTVLRAMGEGGGLRLQVDLVSGEAATVYVNGFSP